MWFGEIMNSQSIRNAALIFSCFLMCGAQFLGSNRKAPDDLPTVNVRLVPPRLPHAQVKYFLISISLHNLITD